MNSYEIKEQIDLEYFIYPAIAVFATNILLYIYCQTLGKKDNSWIDSMWGLSFVIPHMVIFGLRGFDDINLRMILVTSLVIIWGVRLSIYIWNRHKSEDYRYKLMRTGWERQGEKVYYLKSFFIIFMLQGVLSLIINSSVLYINIYSEANSNELIWTDYLGIGIWVIGFLIEVISDQQLTNHLKNPKPNSGKFLKTGFWRYSRHPNYFGESVLWWGIYLISCSLNLGWTTFFSALIITLLIRFLSGVPFPERKYRKNEEWKEYCKETNVFVPWFVNKINNQKTPLIK